MYQKYMEAVSNAYNALIDLKRDYDGISRSDSFSFMSAFFSADSQIEVVASPPVLKAARDIMDAFVRKTKSEDDDDDSIERRVLDVVNAMRADLFISKLDTTHRLWDRQRFEPYLLELQQTSNAEKKGDQ